MSERIIVSSTRSLESVVCPNPGILIPLVIPCWISFRLTSFFGYKEMINVVVIVLGYEEEELTGFERIDDKNGLPFLKILSNFAILLSCVDGRRKVSIFL
jgi:hypothetical protein